MPTSGVLAAEPAGTDISGKTLPEGYGLTMAALLPRDPEWMYAYWEITANTKARILRELGADIFEKARQVLRVHEIPPPAGEGGRHFDVPVMLEAGSWYINAAGPGRSYCAEPGLVLPDGAFFGIVRSNEVTLPAGEVSDVMDAKWLDVSGEFDRLLELSGVEYIGKGSGEVAKSLAQRWELLRSVFSRAASWGVSSLSSRAGVKPPEKKFRLAADCEIILYGAAEPGAFVTVAGRKARLDPDGTFSMRFALPDGNTDMPVTALSKDEKDSRRIGISVTRLTE